MINKNLDKYANKLVYAFLNNKIISPIPTRYTKKLSLNIRLQKACLKNYTQK
jgi:2-keto-4-pentenoate hydratase